MKRKPVVIKKPKIVKTAKPRPVSDETESADAQRAAGIMSKYLGYFELLKEHFVKCDSLIDVIKTGMLARQHILISGTHGVAKSQLTRNCFHVVKDASFFGTTLTKELVAEEVLGPISIDSLKAGNWHRLTDGYLPSVKFAFLDELFRGSVSMFPSLFEILNERTMTNGTVSMKCPLSTAIATTNFVLDDKELLAFVDRFHIQIRATPVSGYSEISRLMEMYNNQKVGFEPDPQDQLTVEEFDFLCDYIASLPLTEKQVEGMTTCFVEYGRKFGADFSISPRRMCNAVDFMKVVFFMIRDRGDVEPLDKLMPVVVKADNQDDALPKDVPTPLQWTTIVSDTADKLKEATSYTNENLVSTIEALSDLNNRFFDKQHMSKRWETYEALKYMKETIQAVAEGLSRKERTLPLNGFNGTVQDYVDHAVALEERALKELE